MLDITSSSGRDSNSVHKIKDSLSGDLTLEGMHGQENLSAADLHEMAFHFQMGQDRTSIDDVREVKQAILDFDVPEILPQLADPLYSLHN